MGQIIQNPFEQQLKGYQKWSYNDQQNTTMVINRTNKKQCLIKKLIFNEFQMYHKYLIIYKNRQIFKSNCIEKLIKHSTIVSQTLCATIHQLYGLWQYHSNTLKDEIEKRVRSSRQFSQKQMLSIVKSMIIGLNELQKNNIIHQKLSVLTIKMTQKDEIKISDPLSLDGNSNYYKIYSRYSNDHIYLSPEECDVLDIGNFCGKSTKNDVWTCGMILLETGLLENQNLCYRCHSRKINWPKIKQNIDRFGQIYGQQLKTLLKLMLTRNKKDRPNCEQLMKKMQQIYLIKSIKINQITINRLSPQIFAYHTLPQINCSSRLSHDIIVNLQGQKKQTHNHDQQNLSIKIQMDNTANNHVQQPTFNQNKQNQFLPATIQSQPFFSSIQGSKMPYYEHLRRFSTFSSKIGYLFSSEPNPPQQCKHLPLSHIKNEQNMLFINPILQQISNPQIKNTQSITFEADLNNINTTQIVDKYPNKLKLKQQQILQSEQILQSNQNQYQQKNINENQLQYIIQNFQDGSKYQGYKFNHMRHGQGKFYYQDGGMYDGQWRCNKMNGKGVLYYRDGEVAYEGDWKNDKFEGKGRFTNETPQPLNQQFNYHDFNYIGECWKYYQGQFKNDLKQGEGKLILTNDEYFIGNFNKDILNGYGRYYGKKQIINGLWENNQLIRQN